jgi:hypothetical protein
VYVCMCLYMCVCISNYVTLHLNGLQHSGVVKAAAGAAAREKTKKQKEKPKKGRTVSSSSSSKQKLRLQTAENSDSVDKAKQYRRERNGRVKFC